MHKKQQHCPIPIPQKLTIGPILLKPSTPLNIYNRLLYSIPQQIKRIHKSFTTQLNYYGGKFIKHMNIIQQYRQWLQRYQIDMLISLNCAHNVLIDVRCITMFYLPRLQILDLHNCEIESIELLKQCFFPNLLTLVLYNNHITNIRSLRTCRFPFLTQLTLDSNNIQDITPLIELNSVHLQKLQIHNNRICDVRGIFRFHFVRLNQLRFENSGFEIRGFQGRVIEKFINSKFTNL